MKQETCLVWSTSWQNSLIIRKYNSITLSLIIYFFREWDRFAKTEYERLAMEEEQGEDSEVLDAMDGWDSEEENQSSGGAANNNSGASPAADAAASDKKW